MEINHNGIVYAIHKNIELMSVIMLLSDEYYTQYPFLKSFEYFYTNKVRQYFQPFIHHDAIQEFNKRSREGFCFDKPLRYAILPQDQTFTELLMNFSSESNFEEFFNSKYEFYNSAIQLSLEEIANIDYIQLLYNYFKTKPSKFNVYFSPTIGSCGLQFTNNNENCCVLGCFGYQGNIPLFVETTQFNEMIIHEFSHGYVNHLIEQKDIDEKQINVIYNYLLDDVNQIYGSSKSMLAEQIVRTVTIRIIERDISKKQAYDMLKRDEDYGFVLVPKLYELLETEYENSCSDFQSFINQIVGLIHSIK